MNKIVRFTISGRAPDTDAPTLEDLLDQMRDYLEILRGVEEAASGSSQSAIDWRVVEASRRSPVSFGMQAFPKNYGTNIDQRATLVLHEVAFGLAAIPTRAERPRHFTNRVMLKAKNLAQRVTNGIGMTKIDSGSGLPSVEFTASVARNAIRNVDQVLAGPGKPYQEIGSIEGSFYGVGLDGYNRRIAYVRERVTGEVIKCVIPKKETQVAQELSRRQIGEVWTEARVQVSGRIFYDGPGRYNRIETDEIRFFRPRSELPQLDDVIDPGFTGGLRAEEYLERMRDGALPQ